LFKCCTRFCSRRQSVRDGDCMCIAFGWQQQNT